MATRSLVNASDRGLLYLGKKKMNKNVPKFTCNLMWVRLFKDENPDCINIKNGDTIDIDGAKFTVILFPRLDKYCVKLYVVPATKKWD